MLHSGFDMDTVRTLAELVRQNDLGEITIVDADKRISIKGKICNSPVMQTAGAQVAANAETAPAQTQIEGNEVKAPIVGTFYAAPSPDSEPFVKVGSQVKKGDTIFIIESMKVMSEVQSEFDGVVKKIFVNSGEAVDFDQTVMVIG